MGLSQNYFGRRAPQQSPLVVLSFDNSAEVRVTRYEKRKCTHLGWATADFTATAVEVMRGAPPDEMRRAYLTAEEASWDNYGRHPDDPLGVVAQMIGTPEAS